MSYKRRKPPFEAGGGGGDVWAEFEETLTTSSCASGSSVTGSLNLGVAEGTVGRVLVQAIAASHQATIYFYADSGLTQLLYESYPHDCYTSPYFDDNTPWNLKYNLTGSLIYYKITNSHSVTTTFSVTLKGYGR